MNTITCRTCGETIEVDKALEGQIEARILTAERHKHGEELARVKAEQDAAVKQAAADAGELARRQLEGEKALLIKQAEADLALERRKIAQELRNEQRQSTLEQDNLIASLKEEAMSAKEDAKKMREEMTQLITQLRISNKARENAELEAQKKLAEEEGKIREEARRTADEAQRLKIAEKDKQLEAAKKQLEEMQRKLSQGSQQLQGEILELDLEESLARNFHDDVIVPVAKGVNGADIRHCVRSQGGIECGVILWELKRTKNWVDGWIPKLKTDLRSAKANIPVIVSEVLPKSLDGDLGLHDGVWVCKPKFTIVLASLLRKSLLDVGREKVIAQNRESSAEALYNFVTSHEFSQQIETMIETYQEMSQQVVKERVTYEKLWAQREKQAQRLLMSTATIVGSMQGHLGSGSMPRIKGLEIDLIEP